MNLHDTKIRKIVHGNGSKSKYMGMLLAIFEYSQTGKKVMSNPMPALSAQYMVDRVVENPISKRLLADIAKYDDFARVEAFEVYDMTELKSWYHRQWAQIMANQRVRDAYIRFGSDMQGFAEALGVTERTLQKWVGFHNLISDRRIIEVFKALEGETDLGVFATRYRMMLGRL